jgi:hypothetical protein
MDCVSFIVAIPLAPSAFLRFTQAGKHIHATLTNDSFIRQVNGEIPAEDLRKF